MKTFLTRIILLAIVTLSAAGTAISAQDTPQPIDPESVFRAQYEAINIGDLDVSLALIAENAVSIALPPPPDTDGVFVGQEAYRGLNSYLIGNNADFEFTDIQVTGNTLTFRALLTEDLFREAGVYPIEFTGTAIVRDGLLVSETWLMDKRDDARLTAAITRQTNIAIVEQLYQDLFVQGNLDIADEIIAPDFINHDFPEDPPGPEPIRQTSIDLRNAMPDLEIIVSKWVVEGDQVVSYVTFQGTHEGEFVGAQPTGNVIEWTQTDIHRIEDGQIAEVWHPIPFTLFEQFGYQLTPPEQ